jgi:exosortase
METRFRPSQLASYAALALSATILYFGVLRGLVTDWWTDENYSHGFLIVPLAGYFVYERWTRLREARVEPWTVLGLAGVLGALLLLAAGILASEFFLTRVSIVVMLASVVLFLWGPQHLRLLAFPIGFLLLMIPIPAIIFNQIAFPLQLLASRFGETVVAGFGVPVLREGNVIVLATTTLEVAEACSGIRSLISLLALGIVYGYFTEDRVAGRALLALATVPVAVLANGLRVAGTGIAAHHIGPAAAEGFFHTFSGWLLFVAAFVMLLGVSRVIRFVLGTPAVQTPATAGMPTAS